MDRPDGPTRGGSRAEWKKLSSQWRSLLLRAEAARRLKTSMRLRNLVQPQVGIVSCAALVVIVLASCGEPLVTIPLLLATLIYAMQLIFVKTIFVNKLRNYWNALIERVKGYRGDDQAEILLSHRFFVLACWGASIFAYIFSLLVLIIVSIYISSDKSSLWISVLFGLLAIIVVIISCSKKAISMPYIENLKELIFLGSFGKLIQLFDRLGVAGAIFSLVIALHALGSIFLCDFNQLGATCDNFCSTKEIKKELSYITYCHSFAMMSGILYVYATHYIMSSVHIRTLYLEFRLIATGVLIFYGSVQTMILVATHLPVYVYVYIIGPGDNLPIEEFIVTLGPAIVGIIGGFISGLPGRR